MEEAIFLWRTVCFKVSIRGPHCCVVGGAARDFRGIDARRSGRYHCPGNCNKDFFHSEKGCKLFSAKLNTAEQNAVFRIDNYVYKNPYFQNKYKIGANGHIYPSLNFAPLLKEGGLIKGLHLSIGLRSDIL